MDIKVRLLDSVEPKSVQEVEKELLQKHEQELNNQEQEPLVIESSADGTSLNQPPSVDLKEEDVLSYIGKRYNKQINSFDELMSERQSAEEMPEDVAAYMKYKKDTGRGFEDFLKLKKDYETMEPENLLKEYLSSTNDGLDSDDIDSMMDDYRYDEDLDDDSKIKKVKITRKKAIAEAKKFFTSQKEKYKMPLESSSAGISDSDKEEMEVFRQYTKQAKTAEEENNRKRQWFDKKTNELFGNEFKGFEFNINDRKMTFAPGDSTELKKNQATPQNFINKFLDENGLMKDAVGYHRSLAMAMNPEKFAKFFYEQGKSDATDDVMRKTKNINMSERRAPEVSTSQDGIQVRAVNPDSGRSLKIRSAKKI
jgi:hypothetical protein